MNISLAFKIFLVSLLLPSALSAFGPFECREQIFFGKSELDRFREEYDFWVVVRVLGDCKTERQVTLVRQGTHLLEAEVLRPVPYSVSQQLEDLKKRLPEAQLEDLCQLVTVERIVYSEKDRPSLRDLSGQLRDISTNIVPEAVIYIHGVDYKIWVGSALNLNYFEFTGPPYRSSTRKGALYPLETWSRELLLTVDASCEPELILSGPKGKGD